MAPVVRFTQLPVMQAGREQRPVHARGELLHARVEGLAAHCQGCGLDDARAGVGFHQPHQRGQAVAAHHAVGIEHYHVAVLAAPAAAEVGHVAGLALHAVAAPAVEDAAEAADGAAQLHPCVMLGGAQVRIAAVRQHDEIEVGQVTGARQRFIGGAQPREHTRHVLIADRHDDRGARLGRYRPVGRGRTRDQVAVAALGQHQEAHHCRPEASRHP